MSEPKEFHSFEEYEEYCEPGLIERRKRWTLHEARTIWKCDKCGRKEFGDGKNPPKEDCSCRAAEAYLRAQTLTERSRR